MELQTLEICSEGLNVLEIPHLEIKLNSLTKKLKRSACQSDETTQLFNQCYKSLE